VTRVALTIAKCHPKFNVVEGVLSQGGFVVPMHHSLPQGDDHDDKKIDVLLAKIREFHELGEAARQ